MENVEREMSTWVMLGCGIYGQGYFEIESLGLGVKGIGLR